jgi:imidazolonepropionase-like amidohydrolase
MPSDYVDQGVTTARNMQGDPVHIRWRKQISDGDTLGPRLYSTGPPIGGIPKMGRKHVEAESVDDARRLVREHKETGYDYIKVYSRISEEIYNAILETAHEIDIPVVGHVPDSVRAKKALASGISSIEHMYGYFWELEAEDSDLNQKWAPQRLFHAVEIDESKIPELVKLTKEAGTWNCPTLWRKENFLPMESLKEQWNDSELRDRARNNRYTLVRALHDGGARLLVGTDGDAHVIHEELWHFVEAGLTPYETLRIATHDAAEYLGTADTIGTVEVGKKADLVLLEGNPLEDISNTKNIVGVMARGAWLPKSK